MKNKMAYPTLTIMQSPFKKSKVVVIWYNDDISNACYSMITRFVVSEIYNIKKQNFR